MTALLSDSYRVALVTGASRGIGAAITQKLAAEGVHVLALARSESALAEVAKLPGVEPIAADVTDLATLKIFEGREIDILVNNAGGIGSLGALQDQTVEETAQVIALNLTAPLLMIQAALPGMVARKRGHILSLSSAVAKAVFPNTTTYAAAKAGLSRAHEVLRYDLAGTNVRFTEIVPGRVETDFYLEAFGQDSERLERTMFKAQRVLSPEDVAVAAISALKMPQHVDVSRIDLMPTDQAWGGSVQRSH
ncbi:SDR family oxidoreductase [Xinfangfangia sp. CPCC 101601]|uniref:SDR family oxidoreductase n=1 Tax=Pseudogemmobacter lacusdianii TaxID=3069608 RepID=A0ABU0W3R9_9RHOB|nr:SDR family oxidoreductase [Xinfangfangia sp. CPCC 101601]MDQ2068110.1 SDR family oxidoreductase [Xinfangfangia sp. CPCC 101601]